VSLAITRRPGDSFVLIDANDPESFVLVKVTAVVGFQVKVSIDAPKNVHILRREILHRYDAHKDVLAEIERMESGRGN
jgi:carbon storage regulator CsrA